MMYSAQRLSRMRMGQHKCLRVTLSQTACDRIQLALECRKVQLPQAALLTGTELTDQTE